MAVVEALPRYVDELQRLALRIGVVEHVTVEQLSDAGVTNSDLVHLRRRLRDLVSGYVSDRKSMATRLCSSKLSSCRWWCRCCGVDVLLSYGVG